MAVQHREHGAAAREPSPLPRWRVAERAAEPERRLVPVQRAGTGSTPPVWNLVDLEVDDAVEVGSDVAYLADLRARGLPVPAAFALGTAAYLQSMQAGGVREQLAELGAQLSAAENDPFVVGALVARAAGLVEAAGATRRVGAAVESAYVQLGIEDLGGARVTVLAPTLDALTSGDPVVYHEVRGARTVLKRVVDCWNQAIGLPHLHQGTGYAGGERAVAVLVQTEVRADHTGTAYVDDLGDIVIRSASGEVALPGEDVATLEHLARRIERHWGRPPELRWAVAQGRPWVLRARPRR
ncbi:MAG: putative phosphoenolpyruvate synthase [Pseudonocardia sp.]|nr:putative phosphoenolpyruvate synthase [Pseudonocardia sp.]